MPQLRITGCRLALDNHQRRVNSPLSVDSVLLSLGAQVIDVIKCDLIKVADSRIEITRDGDIQDQCKPIAPGSLDTDILLERNNRLGGMPSC